MIKFFEECSNVQNGFHKGKSSTRAIYQTMTFIPESLNSEKLTPAICTDLFKAFDSVDYTILISKLEINGIRGMRWNLIKSYLTNCIQYAIELGH